MLYTSRNQQEHSKPRCCLRLEAGTAPTLWGEKVITGTLPYIPGATLMSEVFNVFVQRHTHRILEQLMRRHRLWCYTI